MSGKTTIAMPIGDPAGIGPEICLKTALDPDVRAACRPILVGDADIVDRHAKSVACRRVFARWRGSAMPTGPTIGSTC